MAISIQPTLFYFSFHITQGQLWVRSHVQICITSFEIIVEKLQIKSIRVNRELKVNYNNGNSFTNCEGLIQLHVSTIIVPWKEWSIISTEYVGNLAENVYTDAEREAILWRRKCYHNTWIKEVMTTVTGTL